MKIPANQLNASLKKSLLPCYLVTGDEPLLVQEALDAVRAEARQCGFASRELYVAGSGFDWQELVAAGGNLSLFAEKRIIELRLPSGKPGKAGGSAIIELLQQTAADLLVLISAPKLDKSSLATRWVKAVAASGGALVQIWPIGLRDLPAWITTRMQNAGLQPEQDAVRMIADRVEGNLLAAQQEIEKLRLISGAGPVSVADVDNAVADSSRFDVYKLVDAAVAGDAARALKVLGSVRNEGTEVVIVMWALTRELRTLARLGDDIRSGVELSTALQNAGVWRNRQGLVRTCISRHRPGQFYRLLKMAKQGDAAAKGQLAADPWQIATDIVVGISGVHIRAA